MIKNNGNNNYLFIYKIWTPPDFLIGKMYTYALKRAGKNNFIPENYFRAMRRSGRLSATKGVNKHRQIK